MRAVWKSIALPGVELAVDQTKFVGVESNLMLQSVEGKSGKKDAAGVAIESKKRTIIGAFRSSTKFRSTLACQVAKAAKTASRAAAVGRMEVLGGTNFQVSVEPRACFEPCRANLSFGSTGAIPSGTPQRGASMRARVAASTRPVAAEQLLWPW